MRIDEANIGALLDRFYNFDDGVICSVHVGMRAGPRTCEVIVEAMDRFSGSGWSTVRFMVHEVSEYRFQFGKKSSFEVLSGGVQFAWRNGSLYVVFDAYPDDGPQLPDLAKNMAYVIGSSCD